MARSISDKILYLRLKDKDKDAFIKAYDLYIDNIYRFIYFKVSNKEEAEDLTSSVFLKVWDYIQNNNLGEYNSLKPLLYKVARNLVIDHYRKNSKVNETSLDQEDGKIDIPDEKQDPIKITDIKVEMETVNKALNELKDEYREVIILKYVNELDTHEIAKILDKNKGNVRVLLYRALKSLKEIINDN